MVGPKIDRDLNWLIYGLKPGIIFFGKFGQRSVKNFFALKNFDFFTDGDFCDEKNPVRVVAAAIFPDPEKRPGPRKSGHCHASPTGPEFFLIKSFGAHMCRVLNKIICVQIIVFKILKKKKKFSRECWSCQWRLELSW